MNISCDWNLRGQKSENIELAKIRMVLKAILSQVGILFSIVVIYFQFIV